jgi:hypothetical protein
VRFQTEIGEAISFVQQNAITARHQHRRSYDMLLRDHALNDCVELGSVEIGGGGRVGGLQGIGSGGADKQYDNREES